MAFGFGGLGSSFPQRASAPKSAQVDYLTPYDSWKSDWDMRYAREAASATGPTPGYWSTPSNTESFFNQTTGLLGDSNQNWSVLNSGQTWNVGNDGQWYATGSDTGPVVGI